MQRDIKALSQENAELHAKLEAAEEALRAIQHGEVDALVIYTNEGERIYTLEGADYTYRVMIENISEGVATLQQNGIVLYANQRLSEILDIPLETLQGSNLMRFIKPEDRLTYDGLLRNSTDGFRMAEIMLIRDGGVEVPILLSLSGVENKGERFTCGVFTDLSSQKEVEEILAAEKLARSVLDQASEAIIVCDTDGTIIRASQATEVIAGENPIYKPFESLLPLIIDGKSRKNRPGILQEVLKGNSFRAREARLERTNRSLDLLISAAPLRSESNQVNGCIISLTDISTLKEAERCIQAEGERFKTTLASIGDAVITTSPMGMVAFMNPTAERVTGWTTSEAAGLPVEQVVPIVFEQNYKPAEHPVSRAAKTGKLVVLSNQYALVSRTGKYIPIEDSAAPIRDAAGQILGVVMVFQDVTEKRKAEALLRKNQERLQMTTSATEVGTWDWDVIADVFICDERFRELFELPPNIPLTYAMAMDHVHPDDRQHVTESVRNALASKSVFQLEFRIIRNDGNLRWLLTRGQSVFNPEDSPIQVLGLVLDITDRKLNELEIQSNLAQIEVQHRLIEQRELERQSIARDLHDGPVQELIALAYTLHNIRTGEDNPDWSAELLGIQKSLFDLVGELRAYAAELRPPILSKFGLEKAINAYVQTYQEKHPDIQINFKGKLAGASLSEETVVALYRIFQEALNNVNRHSQASQVNIRLDQTENHIFLEMQDNGVGFEPVNDWLQLARKGHLGMVGMRERAEAVGGKLILTSKPGSGTQVRVVVPLDNQQDG